MLRSPTALRARRGLARRADQVLTRLRLVSPRSVPPVSASWVEVAPEPPPRPAPSADLDFQRVQALLDEMVRPALQSDGGDISLVKVESGEVHVELVGACHSCPSAVLTMKMGVEQLLAEELPGFERLVQVNAPSAEAM